MLIAPQLANSFNCLLRLMPALQTQGRFASIYRGDCSKEKPPRCSEESLKESECVKRKEHQESRESIFKRFFDKPECCPDTCDDAFPPFDDLYYLPSDKAKRHYEQTWVECPEITIKPKEMCCFDQFDNPPLEKRKVKPNTACIVECPKGKGKCIKIVEKGCKKVRDPPDCHSTRKPSDCIKKCTPYPAYSECDKPTFRPLRPIECKCLSLVAMCDVLRAWKRMKGIN